jgi:hypothetical protein
MILIIHNRRFYPMRTDKGVVGRPSLPFGDRKISVSFSVPFSVARDFEETLTRTEDDKHEVAEMLLRAYIAKNKIPDLVKCAKCGAEYSEVLPCCPTCGPEKPAETASPATAPFESAENGVAAEVGAVLDAQRPETEAQG